VGAFEGVALEAMRLLRVHDVESIEYCIRSLLFGIAVIAVVSVATKHHVGRRLGLLTIKMMMLLEQIMIVMMAISISYGAISIFIAIGDCDLLLLLM